MHNIGDHDNNVNMRIDSLGVLSWCVEIGYREWDEERTCQEKKKQNIGHMHGLDIKGGFTLFFWNICNMKHHLLLNGWKCVWRINSSQAL